MKIVNKNVDELIPYINNPRLNDNAVDAVASSIKNYGFKVPIVIDSGNEIITGHTRLKAAKKLGLEEVPCIVADDLTPEQVKAFRIADNKTSEFAEWDLELLEIELEGLDDDIFTGFDIGEVGELFNDDTEVIEDDFDEEPPEEPISKRGDIWLLGKHRLMCGDSTNTEDVQKLMDGKKANMIFTDPPYGVNYEGGVIHGNKINTEHKRDKLQNDEIDIYSQFIPLLNQVIEDGAIYIFYATIYSMEILQPLKENNIEVNSIIVWNKTNTGYADMNSNYKNKYEPFIYGKRKGKTLNFVGPTTENTIWEIDKDRNNVFHPTQKPIEVPARAIRNSSKKNEIVLDLFGGSGSTLIASEQLNRICYMMELDPKYVDVIVNRYINFKESDEDVFLIRDGTQIHYKEVEKNE